MNELHRYARGHRAVRSVKSLPLALRREDDRRDQGELVRLEHVSRHPGAIATLSPTFVPIRAAFARSSSGMPASTLPTRSPSTVGRLVLYPTPTLHEYRGQRARPKPNPVNTFIAFSWKTRK